MTYKSSLAEFKELVSKIEYIKYTMNSLIYWDKITYMPKEGIEYRSRVMSFLADEQYKLFNDPNFLKYVEFFDGNGRNDRVTNSMVSKIKRNFHYVNQIPEDVYRKYIELIAVSEQLWADAKAKSDFAMFEPQLSKIVDNFRTFAEYWGYEDEPYDAMLSYYEDGMTVKGIDKTVNEVKSFLVSFIDDLQQDGRNRPSKESTIVADGESQQLLWKMMLSEMGFDFARGRVDIGSHTTILANSPYDVRIVNTFSEKDLKVGIYNVLHSGGRGIYQQSIDPALLGTFLAEVPSFAMEESMGKFYENIIGRSLGFWSYFKDKAAALIPELANFSAEELYRKVNVLNPSPIRLEADELTYLVHIIIRYELERSLINGEIKVKDLPNLWKEKYRDYLGTVPQNDGEGILQDIHWAAGYIGYFPSYFLSNLWTGQFAAAMEREQGSLNSMIEAGRFSEINGWLKERIFRHGAVYTSEELVQNVTGQPLSSKYYIDYLRKKYSEVYK